MVLSILDLSSSNKFVRAKNDIKITNTDFQTLPNTDSKTSQDFHIVTCNFIKHPNRVVHA